MTLTHRLRRPTPAHWAGVTLLAAVAYAVNTNALWFWAGYAVATLFQKITREGK